MNDSQLTDILPILQGQESLKLEVGIAQKDVLKLGIILFGSVFLAMLTANLIFKK
jgi:hypothetical protein